MCAKNIIAFILSGFLFGCADVRRVSSSDDEQNATGRQGIELTEYIDECTREVGDLPPTDCSDGKDIRIQRTNPDGSSLSLDYEYFTKDPRGIAEANSGDPIVCDNPTQAYLLDRPPPFAGCAPGSKILKQKGVNRRDENYEYVTICRNFVLRDPRDVVYDEIGIIGYNRSTGATCFLSGKVTDFVQDGKPYRSVIKGKGRQGSQNKTDFLAQHDLLRGGGSCLECHSAGPYLLNPYLGDFGQSGNRFIEKTKAGAPYHVVAGERLRDGYGATAPGDGSAARLGRNVAPKCTQCHDIGNNNFCAQIVPITIGNELPLAQRMLVTPEKQADTFGWHQRFFNAPWSSYEASYEKVKSCCARPNQCDCQWTSVVDPPSPPPHLETSWPVGHPRAGNSRSGKTLLITYGRAMVRLNGFFVRLAVRPGGTLLYAVCSVLREEAEGAVTTLPGFRLAAVERFTPHEHGTDGYTTATLVRAT